jgi:hypothetical protein
MLTENHIKEGLSRAYILAVAHRAGFNVSVREFDYGIDGTFHDVKSRDGRLVESGFPLDFQAKASETWTIEDGHVVYDLEAKTHRDLTDAEGGPRILVLLTLPPDAREWLGISDEALVLKRCAWWLSLRGEAPTTNKETQRVRIPVTQRFDVGALTAMMKRVKAGKLP